MKITDKMIEDIENSMFYNEKTKGASIDKIALKEKGYEVEQPKSKLDEARGYRTKSYSQDFIRGSKYKDNTFFVYATVLQEIIGLYEYAIKEIQDNICNTPEYLELEKWHDEKAYKIDELENTIRELKQKPKIDDDLIEWLKSFEGIQFGIKYSSKDDKNNIKRLLNKLGVND